MKTYQKLILCWLIFYLSGCQLAQDKTFPDVELVYQAGDLKRQQVGFINADGSNLVILSNDFLKPFWGYDENRIYGLARSGQSIEGDTQAIGVRMEN